MPQFGGNRHGGDCACCYSPLQVLHLSPKLQEHSGHKTDTLASLTAQFPMFLTLELDCDHLCLLCVVLLWKGGERLSPCRELRRLPLGGGGAFSSALLLALVLALYMCIWLDGLVCGRCRSWIWHLGRRVGVALATSGGEQRVIVAQFLSGTDNVALVTFEEDCCLFEKSVSIGLLLWGKKYQLYTLSFCGEKLMLGSNI